MSNLNEQFREKLRKLRQEERYTKRNVEMDAMRLGLGEIRSVITELEKLSVKDVTGLASRIKRKKHATFDDLFRLNQAFLQNEDNITTFVKIPGAVNVIVKDLTGHDSESQIRACETLCNLSLGDTICCEKIASLAGSYLVTFLDSTEMRTKRTSLWVLMNITASGHKGFEILMSQGLLSKLILMYPKERDTQFLDEISTAIDICLQKNCLRNEDIAEVRKWIQIGHYKAISNIKLLFKILICDANSAPSPDELSQLVRICLSCLKDTLDLSLLSQISNVLYSIRILGNLVAKNFISSDLFLTECSRLDVTLSGLFNKIFDWNYKPISKETIWLVANILNQRVNFQIYLQKDDLVDTLKIKRNSIN